MNLLIKAFSIVICSFLIYSTGRSQCATWVGSPKMDEASDAHVVYRDHMKLKDYAGAFENWKIAYELAPAADGNRHSHFTDGAKIYKNLLKNETDSDKQQEYRENIVRLYDEAIGCYEAKVITPKCKTDECIEQKVGYLMGRKAYDMYYTVKSPAAENLDAFDQSMMKAGNKSEYLVLIPTAKLVVKLFKDGGISPEKARELYQRMESISEHNIENNKKYGEKFKEHWPSAKQTYKTIESDIFDCEYFKQELKPGYDAEPSSPVVLKHFISTLKKQNCDPNDPLLKELEQKWTKYAVAENARLQKELEQSNPAIRANRLYKDGDYNGALKSYQEAISMEADPEKKASYLFSSASIKGRKLKKYAEARATAREAANLRPNWGRPYMLIGDLYATSARNCGDSWNQRLAILAAMDKYSYAKSIDSEVALEAQEKLNRYYSSMPSGEDSHMRGVKKGQSVKVGCWIGETVKVRFR